MKVLLVYPPDPLLKERKSWGPYNLACLAAYLEDISEVSILDASSYTISKTVSAVEEVAPDMVGVTVPFTFFIPNVVELCKGIRAHCPHILIAAGGHGVTFIPEKMLSLGVVDAVVRSEGELTMRELVQNSSPEGIIGLSYIRNGEIVHMPLRPLMDLENSRLPAFHLMDMAEVSVHQMETSRGCPHQCTFCDTSSFYGHKWRKKSPERVIEEIKLLVNRYGAQTLLPADDNITTDMNRVYEIFDGLLKNDIHVSMTLQMRADDIVRNPATIELMSRVGLDVVLIGMESGDADTLERLRKGTNVDTVRKAAEILHANNIHVGGFFILGFPHETAAAMERTVEFAMGVTDTMGANIFIPYPGTELHAQCQREGLILTEDPLKYDQQHQVAKTVEWPELDMEKLYGRMLKKFYHRADWIREHFQVQSGHEFQAVFSKGLWLKYVEFFDLDSLGDWAVLFSAYADLSRNELRRRLPHYTASVQLQMDVGSAHLRIVNGALESLAAEQAMADFTVHVDNTTWSDLLRKMNLDALSAVVMGRMKIEGDTNDALRWMRWLSEVQDIVDVQIIKRAYDQPQCLGLLNELLSRDTDVAAKLAGGTHTYVLQRDSAQLLLRLRAGVITDFKILQTDEHRGRKFKILDIEEAVLSELVKGNGQPLISFLKSNG